MPTAHRQKGMIYIALLLAVALMGGLSAVGSKVAQTIQTRQAENELLAIGLAFRNALQSYAEITPNGMPPAPESLAELLRDSRFPGIKRHLRRVPYDPMTGKPDWGIVRGPDQRILGFHSLSNRQAMKMEGFPPELSIETGKAKYNQWIFSISYISSKIPGGQNK